MINVVTDYGNVALSQKSIKWLESFDKDWFTIVNDKKKRTKKAKFLREKVALLETVVGVAAEIEWVDGGELEKF